MSDFYFVNNNHASSTFHLQGVKAPYKENFKRRWVPRSVVKWSPVIKGQLVEYFSQLDYPFRKYEDIPFPDPLRSEIRRFFISLDAYKESSNPVIPINDILMGATDRDFATYLKRVKRKSFETTWRADEFEYPDWWDKVPAYHINDIGDIFNYSYLILFDQEDEKDFLLGNIDVNIDEDFLENFYETLGGILPPEESVNVIDGWEILSRISPSISYDRKSEKKKSPHFMIKGNYMNFSKKRHKVLRSLIPVSPGNTRDSVINSPDDLNTISFIEEQTLEVLRHMKGHIHLKNKDIVSRRCKTMAEKFYYFIQRDLKKEGITKPRILLKIMLEVLHRTYPKCKAFEFVDFYDDYIVEADGIEYNMKRGHGLGMANALTTLMQLVIHEMIIENCEILIQDKCDTLILNDDFVVGFTNFDELEAYWDSETEIFEKLSIIRETSKSFVSIDHFVIAERYFNFKREWPKESYHIREILLPLACYNIVDAKEYFSAAQVYVNHELAHKYVPEIIAYWGYEFFPNEVNYPTICGGWINEKLNGVDLSLLLLEKLDYNSNVYRAYQACKHKKRYRKGTKWFHSPSCKLFNITKEMIPEEYHLSFDIGPLNKIIDIYGSNTRGFSERTLREKQRIQRKRQQIFANTKVRGLHFDAFLKDIINTFPKTLFYPPKCIVKKYHPVDLYELEIDDVYSDPNPRIAYLSFLGRYTYPFKDAYSINFLIEDSTTKKSMSLFSKEVQKTLRSENLMCEITGGFHDFSLPNDDYQSFWEDYINPLKIGEIVSLKGFIDGYPEIFPEFRSPYIQYKKKIYNYLFNIEELILLTELQLNRLIIKDCVDISKELNIPLIDILEEIKKIYAEKRKIEEEEDTSESSSSSDESDTGTPTEIEYQESNDDRIQKIKDRIIDLKRAEFPLFKDISESSEEEDEEVVEETFDFPFVSEVDEAEEAAPTVEIEEDPKLKKVDESSFLTPLDYKKGDFWCRWYAVASEKEVVWKPEYSNYPLPHQYAVDEEEKVVYLTMWDYVYNANCYFDRDWYINNGYTIKNDWGSKVYECIFLNLTERTFDNSNLQGRTPHYDAHLKDLEGHPAFQAAYNRYLAEYGAPTSTAFERSEDDAIDYGGIFD